MSLLSVYTIMNQIANESSKTGKEQILKVNQLDMEFRQALVFLLNPYIVTGISTKKISKEINYVSEEYHPFLSLEDVMEHILNNNTGRDVDVALVRDYIKNIEKPELQDFVKRFVTKDLKLGISEKTVNKIYGKDTIPSFAVMLAESFEKKHEKVTGKFFITLKLDGNRCVAIKEDGVVKFFSRKGQPIEGLTQLVEELGYFPDNTVYDGELLLNNKDNLPSDELFRATQKVVRKDGEKKDLEFYMFDSLPLSEFKAGKSKKAYEQRRNTLDIIFSNAKTQMVFDDEDMDKVLLLPVLYEGEDKGVIPVMMKEVEDAGYEGLMVNTAKGLYQTKRTTDLLKVKTMKTADLLVMSIEKAIDGQLEGLLGRVNVEYKGNLVGVGSGFSHEERKRFVDNPDEICGKIIEVQFFEESKDEKTGQPSLRFPVFKSIRHDKGVEDINYGE